MIFSLMMSWCLMSSDVIWHIRDKLWPMPKHGSIILYVHGNQKAHLDGQPRTSTSTLTQLLNYDLFFPVLFPFWLGGSFMAPIIKGVKTCALAQHSFIVQELCESRGGRPGLSVLTSLLVSVDVKIYCTVLRHWSQLVPNMSHDIWGH